MTKATLISGVRVYNDSLSHEHGRLTIQGARFRIRPKIFCVAQCLCGNFIVVPHGDLANGHTQSCGCILKEALIGRNTTHGMVARNDEFPPEYFCWVNMRQRCENKNNPAYDRYGGRGIKVCERWNSFSDFLADIGPRPSLEHSLDRFPNNNGNYEPGNVRWATNIEQQNNTRQNVRLTFYGKTMTMTQWGEISGVDPGRISRRLKEGWSEQRAVWTPVNKEWSEKCRQAQKK